MAETLFGHCNIDGFFLEYDSDRAGGFSPLRFIKNQKVVLGLVTSKFPELEKKKTYWLVLKKPACMCQKTNWL